LPSSSGLRKNVSVEPSASNPGPRSFAVKTYGCRVNQADTVEMVATLEQDGYVRSTDPSQAQYVILNTCTVTHRSDADVRKAIHRLKRQNPGAEVIITGCHAQRAPDELVSLRGVSAVVGNGFKSSLPDVLKTLHRGTEDLPLVRHAPMNENDPPDVRPTPRVLDRARPFLKIQDGCDAKCTYCIIPETRGRARSAHPQHVLRAVQQLVDEGHPEIVLTGVHLGTYGEHLEPQHSLPALLESILAIPALQRLRLSCIEPMAFPDRIVDLAQMDRRIAPHFHLPLQSGSDAILKRMVRPYRTDDYARIIDRIRNALPDACVGTDVIVGFPGETDERFAESCRFIEGVGLNYVHVFSYSDRPGTPSTRLSGSVDPKTIKSRSLRLQDLSQRVWNTFLEKQVGRTFAAVVLGEESTQPGVHRVLTDHFCAVEIEADDLPRRTMVPIRIDRLEHGVLFGVLAERRVGT
jgi:threonylcarbamoyladenosine tRNA methylthiotransferase MtaB